MTENSRVQKLLNEQNAEIDRLNFQIQFIRGAAAHAQKSYEQHLAVYRQKLEERPPTWHDDIQSLQERDSIMTNRIEQLEASSEGWKEIADEYFDAIGERNTRIEKLKTALEIAKCLIATNNIHSPITIEIINNALEGKDD